MLAVARDVEVIFVGYSDAEAGLVLEVQYGPLHGCRVHEIVGGA
jgi:hypothetical protein